MYAAENVDGLVAERLPDAIAAAQDVEDAVERFGNAPGHWTALQAEVAALLRLAGRETGAIPQFPAALATLAREARRVEIRVPPPVPGDQKPGRSKAA